MSRSLRTLPLLAAALIALAAPPFASAAGGSAVCNVPVVVSKTQQLGELEVVEGRYKLTVVDTDQIACQEAIDDRQRPPCAEAPPCLGDLPSDRQDPVFICCPD